MKRFGMMGLIEGDINMMIREMRNVKMCLPGENRP